jgi:arylsulfatase A
VNFGTGLETYPTKRVDDMNGADSGLGDDSGLTRRRLLKGVCGAGLALSAGGGMAADGSDAERRPNIVFILIDDLGWKDIGCAGSRYYRTPNIDRLAAEGAFFEQAYSAAPVCSPSRGAIYSGKYPARTKFTTVFSAQMAPDDGLREVSKRQGGNLQNLEALHRHCLSPSETTFAEVLGKAGYATGFVGKWHCGWHESQSPEAQGFQFAAGYRLVPTGTRGHWGKAYIGKCKDMPDLRDDDYMTDALTDRAVHFIKENHNKPFALVLSHFAVHGPLEAPQDLVDKYKKIPTTDQRNPVYAAMIEKVDDSVGRVVDTLRELGLEENTAVFFTSDNGGLSPKATSNYPLMGGKSFSYEAGMRVPLVVRWPGAIAAGWREDAPTVGVDFYPTFLDIAGVAPPPELRLDGASLLPLLTGRGGLAPRPIFFHFPHYTHATGPFSSVIQDSWKLIRFYNDTSGEFQLFNLNDDPYEQADLAGQRPEIVDSLRAVLGKWLLETDAELPRPNSGFDPGQPPRKDKDFTWGLALKERRLHEERLQASRVTDRHEGEEP